MDLYTMGSLVNEKNGMNGVIDTDNCNYDYLLMK